MTTSAHTTVFTVHRPENTLKSDVQLLSTSHVSVHPCNH